MNKHIHSLLLAGTALALVSCGGGKSKNNDKAAVTTVYAAGNELGADSKSHAMLWTDGAAKQLSGNPSRAYSVFVSGSNVYVAGAEDGSDGNPRATLWKNGVAQRLSDLESEAASVFVSGDNVYVAGYDAAPQNNGMYRVTLWKDGANQNIRPDKNTSEGSFAQVFVSGRDVYVGFTTIYPYYIQNGAQEIKLNPSGYATIKSLYAFGNTLHCAGWWQETGGLSRAVIFKVVGSDVTPQYLDAGASSANSVFVSGSNVYAAGYTGNVAERRAKVWKDGAAQALSNLRSEASSVFVSGGDVYVGGSEYVGDNASDQRARVWKNGTAQNLSNRQSAVTSVYVAVK